MTIKKIIVGYDEKTGQIYDSNDQAAAMWIGLAYEEVVESDPGQVLSTLQVGSVRSTQENVILELVKHGFSAADISNLAGLGLL